MRVKIFTGKIDFVHKSYERFLEEGHSVVSTTMSKDYTEYGRTETFVFIVTYNPKPDQYGPTC